jgi:hypothetical protein
MEPEDWDSKTWKSVFTRIVELTVTQSEEVPDVIEGSYALGARRAEVLGRTFWPGEDVVYAMTLFCWWPFKPAMSIQAKTALRQLRGLLFKGASQSYEVRVKLVAFVPTALLELNTQDLFKYLTSGEIAYALAGRHAAPG